MSKENTGWKVGELNGIYTAYPLYNPMRGEVSPGFTKREVFAMAAMQGMYAAIADGNTKRTHSEITKEAVDAADELLKALES